MSEYYRCRYITDDTKNQCAVWYDSKEHASLCHLHRDASSVTLATMEINRESYILQRDNAAKLCYEMNLEELEVHISTIEKAIEFEKTNLMTARAVKMDKLENLTEDERKERRKIVTPHVKKEEKKKVVTAKNDPIKFMMQLMNCTESKARELMGFTSNQNL